MPRRDPLRSGPPRVAATAAVLAVAILAAGCATRTTLSSVWTVEEGPGDPVESAIVLGIGTSETSRRQFEDHLAAALRERGVRAAASYRLVDPEGPVGEAALRRAVERQGFEGVVVTRLLRVDEEQVYVPPQTSMSMGFGRGYYGYYGSAWGMNYTPGYVQSTTIVRLETGLYDAAEDRLVWSAHSDTFQPRDVDDTIESVTKAVVARLAEDGFIP